MPSASPVSASGSPVLTLPRNEIKDAREIDQPRLPRAVQALYLQPLRREAEFGVPSCNLQLRSYSLPNLEVFCDFALRAAYFLNLPAYGPVPLPKITERWTVPRDHFIFKKSQENYERITRRRLIQIRDGHPETVQIWLAYLQKHAYWGIGMKANVWEYDSLGKTSRHSVYFPERPYMLNHWLISDYLHNRIREGGGSTVEGHEGCGKRQNAGTRDQGTAGRRYGEQGQGDVGDREVQGHSVSARRRGQTKTERGRGVDKKSGNGLEIRPCTSI